MPREGGREGGREGDREGGRDGRDLLPAEKVTWRYVVIGISSKEVRVSFPCCLCGV